MRLSEGKFVLSATDLAHFLSCRHLTALDMGVALGKRQPPPVRDDPTIDLLTQRGQDHERSYVEQLRARGKRVFDAKGGEGDRRSDWITRTRGAMERGVDIIVQGALGDDHWFGIADIIERVPKPSALGAWSYEVTDTKLAAETRAGTILQLGLYSELVAAIQGSTPEFFHVVTPLRPSAPSVVTATAAENVNATSTRQTFRLNDYAAYFRLMRRRLLEAVALGDDALGAEHYPDPVEHCSVCRWWSACEGKRDDDDHSSLVAGITRLQRRELAANGAPTLTSVARLGDPLPFKPRRGSRDSYARVVSQALVQLDSGDNIPPLHRLRELEVPFGLCRLPEPSPGDVFLDLEGDPFARERGPEGAGGREYLFGVVTMGSDGSPEYREFWAFDDHDERAAFEEVIDLIGELWKQHEGMHVYHYAPYEPSAFKRLRNRHVTRGDEMDSMLRSGRFVDLYAVVRESMQVGVRKYSIKDLEPLHGWKREEDLRKAGRAREKMALALGSGRLELVTQDIRETIARYNKDDCVSTLRLRDWLEGVRQQAIDGGADIPRPQPASGDASKELDEKAQRVEDLRKRLLNGISEAPAERNEEQQARWILAYLLDWHRREDNATWFEYFRLRALPDEDLIDERCAVSGLEFVTRVGPRMGKKGKPTSSMIDRYTYPLQEMEVAPGDEVHTREISLGRVAVVDRLALTIDIVKGPSRLDINPTSVFAHSHVPPDAMEKALFAIAERVAADGTVHVEGGATDRAARDLLLRNPPRLHSGAFDGGSTDVASNQRIVLDLDETVLAVQGPPGSGKTYQGARMICALVAAGKRVGVTASSHKVIRNLLEAVAEAAETMKVSVSMAHKNGDDPSMQQDSRILEVGDNKSALDVIQTGTVSVLGGTSYMWARGDFARAVDVLFVDEAGQMALANAVAVSQAASSVVLLGDPQQLEQPTQGVHPDGVGASALEHILGEHQTITSDRGVFLGTTWRLSPALCEFTSEMFYESKLHSLPGLDAQCLSGAGEYDGSGLFVVQVPHDGNRNVSDEEVEVVASLVARLTAPGVQWVNAKGEAAQMRGEHVLVVSPYNAQVNRLMERLVGSGVRVGTVDKLQGQEAPVVIYSMATSRPEDAPRGLEFLYSLNRLNVATSRARCAAILVASPALFEPECRSPRQMRLANGVCRFVEMAKG